jgi:hypothetical protein
VTDRVPPVKRTPATEPLRRGRALVVLRRRMEEYAAGLEPPEDSAEAPRPDRRPTGAATAAHLLGEGQRRGLKGGPEVLEKARATYLNMEYSGRFDRRPRKGRITKTEV